LAGGSVLTDQGLLPVAGGDGGGGGGGGVQVQGCFEGGAAGWVELEPAEQHPGGVGGAGQAPAGVRVGVVPVGAGGVQDVQEPGGEVVDGSGAELPGVFGEERVDLAGAGGAVVVDRGQDPSGDPVQGFRCDVQVGS